MISGQPLLTLKTGAPHTHISNVRLLGRLEVKGGELELVNCSIDFDDWQESAVGRSLSSSARARPISIDGGHVSLIYVMLSNHTSGAIHVRTASLVLVESSVQGNRAPTGGATHASEGSVVWLHRSYLTENVADTTGGALQVRCCTHTERTRDAMRLSHCACHPHMTCISLHFPSDSSPCMLGTRSWMAMQT
jgi:hypothetical protein